MRAVSTFRSGSHVSIFGQAQKWKLRRFPASGPPKSGNCGRISSFGPAQVVNRKLFKSRSFKSWLRVYHSLLASNSGLCQ